MNAPQRWTWVTALVVSFLAALLAGVPARFAAPLLPRGSQQALAAATGTIWHGDGARLALGSGLGTAEVAWHLRPFASLTGGLTLAVTATLASGSLAGDLRPAADRIRVSDGSLDLDLAPLAGVVGLAPGGLQGHATLRDLALELRGGDVVALECRGDVQGLAASGGGERLALGDLSLVCEDGPGGPQLRVTDHGGPLALQALVQLSSGARFLMSGTAGARPGAPRTLTDVLPLLGLADGPNRVRFRYAGTLPLL